MAANQRSGPALRRLPGSAKPRAEALREYEELRDRRRSQLPGPLWDLFTPQPEKLYRWRVELDCGCIPEVMTLGDDDLPAERQWRDGHGRSLPRGQMICVHDEERPAPYREVVEWTRRREVQLPADPEEPPDYWSDQPDLWRKLRHAEPYTTAFWTVTLSCGHQDEKPTDIGWKPADGPRQVTPKRLAEMRAEFEEDWTAHPEPDDERDRQERDHFRRMLDLGWPRPNPEVHCYSCLWSRSIVAYQRAGWLVDRKKTTSASPPQPSRSALETRLRKAEADAGQLRKQLARLDATSEES